MLEVSRVDQAEYKKFLDKTRLDERQHVHRLKSPNHLDAYRNDNLVAIHDGDDGMLVIQDVPINVTGRDQLITAKAYAYAIATINMLPDRQQEASDCSDMQRLFKALIPDDRERQRLLDAVFAHIEEA